MNIKIVVKKSSELARAHHNLSLIEQRFINMCIGRKHYSEYVDEGTKYIVRVDRFAAEFSMTEREALRQFKDIQKSLPNKLVLLPESQSEPVYFVNEIVFKNNNEVYIKFDDEIIEHIGNLSSNFIRYDISVISKLESSYSIRLYEILKTRAYDNAKWCYEVDILELKSILGIVHGYTRNSDLNKMINSCVKEINKLTDIEVTVKYSKLNRTIIGYSFELSNKTKG